MKRKLIYLMILVLLLGTLLTGFLSLSLVRSHYVNEVENRLLDSARLIEAIFVMEGNLEEERVQELVEDLSGYIEGRITLVDEKGVVLGDTAMPRGGLLNHLSREEIQSSMEGKIGTAIRTSESVGEELLYLAITSQLEDGRRFTVRVALPLEEIEAINQSLMVYILFSIAVGSLLAAILGYRFISRLTEPIKELTEGANDIARGNMKKVIKIKQDDEIGELAFSFNAMREKLKESFEALEDRNQKFHGLLTSITNPIIAVDRSKKVILFNPAAENLFDKKYEEVYGKHILEVIRDHVLDERVQKIFDENQETAIEWELHYPKKRQLKMNTSLIRLPHDAMKSIGMVASIEDLSEMKKLERMRSDFVANVSHELKTPLTSIKGFVETLKNGGIEDEKHRGRFLDIIEIETDRLTRLIGDILTLSEIEGPLGEGKKGPVNLRKAIEATLDVVAPLAEEKKISLVFELEKELPVLKGNEDWFKQMMINLLDNGVKYTPEGGEIRLRVYKKYGHVVISVKDNGIGIPKKELPRLFERFYRVDKGRSRKVGGTGLGLAIVKHVAIAFEGSVKVHSEEGKGTEFVVMLPFK